VGFIAWGLWNRRAWARQVAMVFHGVIAVAALGVAVCCIYACVTIKGGPDAAGWAAGLVKFYCAICGGVAFGAFILSSGFLWWLWRVHELDKDNVAAWDEKLKVLAERGGIVKVRVELTSYVNRDAIRGDLERAGFLETDERTLLEKVFSSGSVKWVTGTINASRIEELAAVSFVKSVESKGSMDGRGA
jgi:hypothetical protein